MGRDLDQESDTNYQSFRADFVCAASPVELSPLSRKGDGFSKEAGNVLSEIAGEGFPLLIAKPA